MPMCVMPGNTTTISQNLGCHCQLCIPRHGQAMRLTFVKQDSGHGRHCAPCAILINQELGIGAPPPASHQISKNPPRPPPAQALECKG
jgi:hypothetical protein